MVSIKSVKNRKDERKLSTYLRHYSIQYSLDICIDTYSFKCISLGAIALNSIYTIYLSKCSYARVF